MASASGATSSGATAITISCTGTLRVVAPFMTELVVIGMLRIVTGDHHNSILHQGYYKTSLWPQESIRSRHDVGPQPPGIGMAGPRHIHGHAGQQVHVVALFQLDTRNP